MIEKFFTCITVIALISVAITGCDTTKNIYRSSPSKKDYVTIDALTLTHCGCTWIYAESFKNGKKEFRILYNDYAATKVIYSYGSNSRAPQVKRLRAITGDNFTVPFDEVDARIFSLIDSAIVNKKGIIYPISRTIYKGYVLDTPFE